LVFNLGGNKRNFKTKAPSFEGRGLLKNSFRI
jgi:hypothetical protein